MIELNRIYNEDCLEGMKRIPDGSVDMILCDLPYGTMKGAGLDGWSESSTAWDKRLDTDELFKRYEKVLRKNGSCILFSQEPYTSVLRTHNPTNIEFAYPLIWKKDHFANALIAKKAPVSYFEDLTLFYKKHDSQLLHPLREYVVMLMKYMDVKSCKAINEILGHSKAEHFFRADTMQFSLCTKATYEELITTFHIDKMEGFRDYEDLEEINRTFSRTFSRTFNIPDGKKFVGNVLEFKKDYKGLHPTQKPIALCEYLIKTYTNQGETVLDNCMGSGTTAIACINTNRNYIGFELDKHYCDIANERIQKALAEKEEGEGII